MGLGEAFQAEAEAQRCGRTWFGYQAEMKLRACEVWGAGRGFGHCPVGYREPVRPGGRVRHS